MYYQEDIKTIKNKLDSAKNHFYIKKGKAEQMTQQADKLRALLDDSINQTNVFEQVKILLQKTSDYAREQSRIRIEALVTNCLQYIFDSNMEFKIEIVELRGKPEAEFYVISDSDGEKIKTKPQEARGGGVVDVISLALRLAMLQCSSVQIDGPLILDEPAKHVSDEYISQVADFIKQAGIIFERQVIMVTHNKHLTAIADKAYRIEHDGSKSVITIES